MQKRFRLASIIFILLTGFNQSHGQADLPPLKLYTPCNPGRVIIASKPTVYYELYIINQSPDAVEPEKLAVKTANSMLLLLNKENLQKRFACTAALPTTGKMLIAPGDTAIVYIELMLPQPAFNDSILHRLVYTVRNKPGKKFSGVDGGSVQLSKDTPIVLGAPLAKGYWAAVYDPAWQRGHRRVLYTVDSKTRIPGRFAIDFIRLDTNGHYASGNDDSIKNWLGYANDVLAVADGIVAATRNDFTESPALSGHPAYSSAEATGNYISINIDNGRFAFYEHLKPGSIRVKPGEHVKKGDVIASVGFTGQTTGPHLHFHVADANSALGAEGIPFVFDSFFLNGAYPDFEKFGKAPWQQVKNIRSIKITRERPAPNTVINF